jgi:imidazolonepropionase-like amidohydrolase
VIDSPGGKEEALELRLETAAILAAAGVAVALHTDDPITDSRLFLRSGGLAVRGGLPEAEALAALTLNGARMLGLQDRVGSLEPGKDADLVVLSGPPFSVWTQVEQTWVEGLRVFDRADPVDLRYATGGWDVVDRYPGFSSGGPTPGLPGGAE